MTVTISAPGDLPVDLGALRAVIRVIEEHADTLARQARTVEAAARTTQWQSPAGDLALARIGEAVAGLLDDAERARRTADAVRRHVFAVESAPTPGGVR